MLQLSTIFADDMGGMKRLAVTIAALGVVWLSASAVGPVEAYQPVDDEEFTVSPDQGAPEYEFTATLLNCFPGETVIFSIAVPSWMPPAPPVPPEAPDVIESVSVDCPSVGALQVDHVFNAPIDFETYPVTAFMAAEDDPNPDIPDRPDRLLVEYINVCDPCVPLGGGSGGGEIGGGAAVIVTSGSSDIWPSFMSSAPFYRTFLALLALMAGIFFVWLWRRRREDERLTGTYRPGPMAPPDPGTPSLA